MIKDTHHFLKAAMKCKRLSIALIFLLLCSASLKAQLKLQGVEKNSRFNALTNVDEITGAIFTDDIIPKEEYMVHSFNGVAFTRERHPLESNQYETISKYTITNGNANRVASFQIPIYASIKFFNNGAFTLIENLGEGGGYGDEIKVYDNNFRMIQSFIPYAPGLGWVDFDTDGKEMIIGTNSIDQKNPKFFVIDDTGKLLFEKSVSPQEGEIKKVLCSSGYYCINVINYDRPRSIIQLFNRNGNQIWSRDANEPNQWRLTATKQPILVTATSNSLYIFDALTGNQIDQKSYASIYSESGVTKLRNDGLADIISLTGIPNTNTIIVLLSEIYERKGNLLYAFTRTFTSSDQKVQISDCNESLRSKLAPKGLLIIKDNEIMKFDYVNEK
jgi:hypothetical protein